MLRPRTWLFALWLVSGCQKNDPSVQPEKLATSAVVDAPPPRGEAQALPADAKGDGAPGPLLPYAKNSPSSDDGDGVPSPDAPPAATGEPSSPPSAAPRSATTAPAKKSPTRVELLKAGAEPRKQLRFAPAVGLVDKMTMTMTLAMGVKVGERAIPKNALPPMVVKMDLKVTDVEADGDVRYEFTLTGTDVKAPPGTNPKLIAPMKQALSRLHGLGGHALMSSRGQSKETKVKLPEKVDQQTQQILQGMEQALNQIVVAVPEQPVGRGAQWTATTAIEQNGIELAQELTYDLEKLEGETAHCRVTARQHAKPQKVAAPGGVVLDLTSLTSKGTGSVTFRLDHIAPAQSLIALTSVVEMGAKGETMKMDTDMTVEMRSP